MIMNLLKNKLQLFVTLIFLGYVGRWISFQHVVTKLGTSVQDFGYTYGFIALAGSIIGFYAARKWGGFKTVLGKALMFFAFSLFAQDAGQIIYAYYIVVAKIQIPYPSWGDVAYFGSVLLYITSALYLAKATGVKFALRRPKYKVLVALIPIVLVGVSYAIILHNHQYDTSKPLTVFLDAGYPVGQAIYISIAVLAYLSSRKLLGGVMRHGILFIIFAFSIQYISDFTFIFQSNRGTYVPGGRDDLLYLVSYFVATTAMIKFYATYAGLKSKPSVNSVAETDDR